MSNIGRWVGKADSQSNFLTTYLSGLSFVQENLTKFKKKKQFFGAFMFYSGHHRGSGRKQEGITMLLWNMVIPSWHNLPSWYNPPHLSGLGAGTMSSWGGGNSGHTYYMLILAGYIWPIGQVGKTLFKAFWGSLGICDVIWTAHRRGQGIHCHFSVPRTTKFIW